MTAVAAFRADARVSRHNGPTIPVSSPRTAKSSSRKTHVKKKQELPPSPSPLAARRTLGATETRESTVGGSEGWRRGDLAYGRRADEPRLSRDPQADRAVCVRWQQIDKEPAETWRQYGPLFRAYSTNTITPELLAALAQVESTGNPVARTYWRWQLSLNPLAVYQPASSAVGLYQMTDAAYAEAARSCIRGNAVVDAGCGFTSLYIRTIPSHAIELTSVYLDRNVAAVLVRAPEATASPQQKQDLAAFIHLCGAGPATAFARRNFQMMAGERCGDHLVAVYLAKVNAMKRQFLRLAADGRN